MIEEGFGDLELQSQFEEFPNKQKVYFEDSNSHHKNKHLEDLFFKKTTHNFSSYCLKSTQSSSRTLTREKKQCTDLETYDSESTQIPKKELTFAQKVNKETKDLWVIIYNQFKLNQKGSKEEFFKAIEKAIKGNNQNSEYIQKIVDSLRIVKRSDFISVITDILENSNRTKSEERRQYDMLAINNIFNKLIKKFYPGQSEKTQQDINKIILTLLPDQKYKNFKALNFLKVLIEIKDTSNIYFAPIYYSIVESEQIDFQICMRELLAKTQINIRNDFKYEIFDDATLKMYFDLKNAKPIRNCQQCIDSTFE